MLLSFVSNSVFWRCTFFLRISSATSIMLIHKTPMGLLLSPAWSCISNSNSDTLLIWTACFSSHLQLRDGLLSKAGFPSILATTNVSGDLPHLVGMCSRSRASMIRICRYPDTLLASADAIPFPGTTAERCAQLVAEWSIRMCDFTTCPYHQNADPAHLRCTSACTVCGPTRARQFSADSLGAVSVQAISGDRLALQSLVRRPAPFFVNPQQAESRHRIYIPILAVYLRSLLYCKVSGFLSNLYITAIRNVCAGKMEINLPSRE